MYWTSNDLFCACIHSLYLIRFFLQRLLPFAFFSFYCLLYFDWSVCLHRNRRAQSLIYFTFSLKEMCLCLGIRVCGCRLNISRGKISVPHRSHCVRVSSDRENLSIFRETDVCSVPQKYTQPSPGTSNQASHGRCWCSDNSKDEVEL